MSSETTKLDLYGCGGISVTQPCVDLQGYKASFPIVPGEPV